MSFTTLDSGYTWVTIYPNPSVIDTTLLDRKNRKVIKQNLYMSHKQSTYYSDSKLMQYDSLLRPLQFQKIFKGKIAETTTYNYDPYKSNLVFLDKNKSELISSEKKNDTILFLKYTDLDGKTIAGSRTYNTKNQLLKDEWKEINGASLVSFIFKYRNNSLAEITKIGKEEATLDFMGPKVNVFDSNHYILMSHFTKALFFYNSFDLMNKVEFYFQGKKIQEWNIVYTLF